jgi:hypothetical protein
MSVVLVGNPPFPAKEIDGLMVAKIEYIWHSVRRWARQKVLTAARLIAVRLARRAVLQTVRAVKLMRHAAPGTRALRPKPLLINKRW